MYSQLSSINHRPQPFEFSTTEILWNDPYISQKMLEFHLNEDLDLASRNKNFVDRSIQWITSHFSVGHGTKICDFGCGPGIYTLQLALTGASVTGVDFSQNSIAYARNTANERGLVIDYVLQDYLQYETEESYDLITMIMCDFCVLSPVQRNLFLKKARRLLKKDGAFLFDGYTLPAFDKRQEIATYEHLQMDGFWSAEDYYGFLNVFKYPEDKVVLDQYTVVERNRTRKVYNWLQYFNLDYLAEELKTSGLFIAERLSDVAGSPYSETADEFALVVRRE